MDTFWSVSVGDLLSIIVLTVTGMLGYARLVERITRLEALVQVLMRRWRPSEDE